MSEKTIKTCFEKCGFGNPNVVADKTVHHEFEEHLQELSSHITVEEFLEFDDCVDKCGPEVSMSSVDWREELRAKCIQLVTNQSVDPGSNCFEFEDSEEDAMEIDSKSAVNSGETLAMLDKLQVFFEENDAENEVLRSVTSLTKKVEKMRIESKKQIFLSNFFCSYECKPKQKYLKRKISHLKVFVFIFLSPKYKFSIFVFNQN